MWERHSTNELIRPKWIPNLPKLSQTNSVPTFLFLSVLKSWFLNVFNSLSILIFRDHWDENSWQKKSNEYSRVVPIDQWFSNLSWGPPTTAYFVCLPHLTHLIQLISSLVESARLEMGVAYERDIQNVWWLGVPRTGLRTTAIDDGIVYRW